jgi:hypothetical protein
MTALTMEAPFDRRQLLDRRQCVTSLWQALRWRGRRRGFRRAGEGLNAYVDGVAPRGVALVLLLLITSALDAWLTMVHVQQGGQEANPIMAFVLLYGYTPFIAVKMALTSVGAWLLAVHQQFPLAWKGLHGMAAIYLLLMGYHGLLMW